MSDNANCEEQREEQTELEEAGGAEVRWFKVGIVFSPHSAFTPFTELLLKSQFPQPPSFFVSIFHHGILALFNDVQLSLCYW